MTAIDRARSVYALLAEVARAPRLTINLGLALASVNDPFFAKIVRDFHRHAVGRHPRFPLVRRLEYGYAVGRLPPDGATYLAAIEASGRRNVKKAMRLGYEFRRIDTNDHLGDVTEILRSSRTRQGRPMPDRLVRDSARPHSNPPSRSAVHDYPYFGVLREGRLHAYAGCLVAGELCAIESIYGHAESHSDGVVPLLIASIAGYMRDSHGSVEYYSYGTYFGAGESMRRFKRKFGFEPHRVRWELGGI